MKKNYTLLVLLLLTSIRIFSQTEELQKAQNYLASKGEVCFTFKAQSEAQVQEISEFLSIGHKVNRETLEIEAYANPTTFQQFLGYNLPYTVNSASNEFPIENVTTNMMAWDTTWDSYPTYTQYVAKMNYYASTYPNLCTLENIGTTVNGRSLLVLKISDNVTTEEAEPEFFYTSSMHGDELAGYPLMLRLIDYLLTNYGSSTEVTDLVNSTEIYINPLANPDGAYRNTGNNTITNPIRANANGQDINRNFPDNIAGIHYEGNYQPETRAFMNFEASRDFVLAANFHGGTEVVNYPYDNTTSKHVDHDHYEYISQEYVNNVHAVSPASYMDIEYDYPENPSSPGVTQGAIWYVVYGGRQDYMNFYRHSKEVTIELSNTKFLSGSQLPNHWNYNRQAFLDYIKQANYGFQGIITDESGNPVVAKVHIDGHDAKNSWVTSNPDHGDYYRLIEQGSYNVTYSAPGYQSQTINVSVTNNTKTVQNVTMVALTSLPTASDVDACQNNTASLNATGNGTLNWYENIDDETPVFTGANYTTPNLTTTTSYYVEDVISKPNVGSTNSNSSGGYLTSSNNNRYLIFNATESVLLEQVTINSNQAGELEIQLQDSSGGLLDARIILLENSGLQTIDLDFIIPVGNDFRLTCKQVSSGLRLYRNNSGVSFPYNNGSIEITSSSAGNGTYYFFYDWKLSAYKSARKEVTVNVNPNPEANFTFVVNATNNGEVTFTNSSSNAATYSWDFGDTIGSSANTNPVYTFSATGTYNVTLTSNSTLCGNDSITIPVYVEVETLSTVDEVLSNIAIYPNPFTNEIHINIETASSLDIAIYDISGRTITNAHNVSTNNTNLVTLKIDETLSAGSYFIKLTNNETAHSVVKQLIKQ